MCIIFTGLLFHENEIQKIFFFFFNSRITFERKHLEFYVVHLIWTTQDKTYVNCTHVESRKISEIHKYKKLGGNYAEFKSCWKNGWMCIIFTSLFLHESENSIFSASTDILHLKENTRCFALPISLRQYMIEPVNGNLSETWKFLEIHKYPKPDGDHIGYKSCSWNGCMCIIFTGLSSHERVNSNDFFSSQTVALYLREKY